MKTSVVKFPIYTAIWLVLILFISLFSCTDKDNPTPADPEEEVKISKIIRSETDYQQFTYNPQGKISRYISQWTYIENNSDVTKRLVANFEYDHAGLLTKVLFDSGFFNKYYYEGNTLKKTEEYDHKSRLRLVHTYTFSSTGKLTEMLTQVYDLVDGQAEQIKRVYTYDGRGNVTEEKTYGKLPGKPDFYLSTTTSYENYDDKRSAENQTALFPYLPGIRMNVNNPQKQTVLGGAERTLVSSQTFTYTYNENNYPASKTVKIETSPTVPPITATYQYE